MRTKKSNATLSNHSSFINDHTVLQPTHLHHTFTLTYTSKPLLFDQYGQGRETRYGVDQIPSNTFYSETKSIVVSTEGGIGLELVEAV
jgi:hypothetical protein